MSGQRYELICDDDCDEEAQEVTLVAVEDENGPNAKEQPPPAYGEEASRSDDQKHCEWGRKYEEQLGTFFDFFMAFWIVLLLSLPGYLISVLISLSAATRSGAISGFGGSVIVMTYLFSSRIDDTTWLLMWLYCLGFLLIIQGFMAYGRAKQYVSVGKPPPTGLCFN